MCTQRDRHEELRIRSLVHHAYTTYSFTRSSIHKCAHPWINPFVRLPEHTICHFPTVSLLQSGSAAYMRALPHNSKYGKYYMRHCGQKKRKHGALILATLQCDRLPRCLGFLARRREESSQVCVVARWRDGFGGVGRSNRSYLGRAINARALLSPRTHGFRERGDVKVRSLISSQGTFDLTFVRRSYRFPHDSICHKRELLLVRQNKK